MYPLVSCLCPTYGRFSKLCEAVTCFVDQDYDNKEMIILNSHPVPLYTDLPQVRIVNDPSLFYLGDIHNRLLDEASGDLLRTWDDDDLYLPHTISQGVQNIPDNKAAWKPKFSWSWKKNKPPVLYGNIYEASTTWRADFLKSVRFTSGMACHNYRQVYDELRRIRGLAVTDMGRDASYVYRFGWGPAHISVASSREDDRSATETWRSKNNDTGDGKLVDRVPLSLYWDVIEDRKHELFDIPDTGWQVELQRGFHAWNMSKVFNDIEWHRANGTKNLGVLAASMIIAFEMKTVIEIGIRSGFTTQLLARGLSASSHENGLLISCDIEANAIPRAEQVVNGLPLKTVRVCGDSSKIDWKSLLDGRILDGVLIDGDHSYDGAMADLTSMESLLRPDGIVWFHDYSTGHRHAAKALDDFVSRTGWNKLVVPQLLNTNDAQAAVLQRPA